eukprot:3205794-Amphidinium_carterae.4
MASRPGNEVLGSVLWHHMKRSKSFQHDMLLFEHMDDKDPTASYEHLLGVLRRQDDRNRFQCHVSQLLLTGVDTTRVGVQVRGKGMGAEIETRGSGGLEEDVDDQHISSVVAHDTTAVPSCVAGGVSDGLSFIFDT